MYKLILWEEEKLNELNFYKNDYYGFMNIFNIGGLILIFDIGINIMDLRWD